jgi:hypothetical protein
MDLPMQFLDDESAPAVTGGPLTSNGFRSGLLALYPHGEVLAIFLHSVVDLWGFSLYRDGQLIRLACGSADDGLISSVGTPLPEELSSLRGCPIEKVCEEGDGEGLVFDVLAARMLGKRFDEVDGFPLLLSEYENRSRGLLSRIKSVFRG